LQGKKVFLFLNEETTNNAKREKENFLLWYFTAQQGAFCKFVLQPEFKLKIRKYTNSVLHLLNANPG